MKSSVTLSVILPAYNEELLLESCVKRILAVKEQINLEIIAVNDCSTDRTLAILQSFGDEIDLVLNNERNLGKGASIKRAITHAQGKYVVFQDADLEYNPQDWTKLLKALEETGEKVAYGSRFLTNSFQITKRAYLANQFLNLITRILYNIKITDMETCMKMVSTDVLKTIEIKSNDFRIEPEITAKLLRKKLKILELPISYKARSYEEGKKIKFKDAILALIALFKYRFVD